MTQICTPRRTGKLWIIIPSFLFFIGISAAYFGEMPGVNRLWMQLICVSFFAFGIYAMLRYAMTQYTYILSSPEDPADGSGEYDGLVTEPSVEDDPYDLGLLFPEGSTLTVQRRVGQRRSTMLRVGVGEIRAVCALPNDRKEAKKVRKRFAAASSDVSVETVDCRCNVVPARTVLCVIEHGAVGVPKKQLLLLLEPDASFERALRSLVS